MHCPMLVESDRWSRPKMCSVAIFFGMASRIDLGSEFIRWMGSIRFLLAFAYLLIGKSIGL